MLYYFFYFFVILFTREVYYLCAALRHQFTPPKCEDTSKYLSLAVLPGSRLVRSSLLTASVAGQNANVGLFLYSLAHISANICKVNGSFSRAQDLEYYIPGHQSDECYHLSYTVYGNKQ